MIPGRLWQRHSKTVVGLTIGGVTVVAARFIWPKGGPDFDLVTIVGGVLLSFGLQGIVDRYFCEVSKPEDPT